MLNKKYNVLIIGAGKEGAGVGQGEHPNKIINFAHAINDSEYFNLIGFVDRDHEKSREAAKKWNTKDIFSIEYAFDTTFNENIIMPDIVVVATNDTQHYEILKKIVKYPLKLVICEKPICKELQQAKEIVELYKTNNIPLLVNYTRRFLKHYQGLKDKYDEEKFGKLVHANIVFNRGWEHTASHAIDFMEWLFDGKCAYEIKELKTNYRIWQINLFFEEGHWNEEHIDGYIYCNSLYPFDKRHMSKNFLNLNYYDRPHYEVMDNAHGFLCGFEQLKCSGEDALKTLEKTYELMNRAQ